MKLITLSFMTQAIAVLGSIYDTILPTISPTITKDPWPCTTEVLEKYFDPPKPTGELLTTLLDYGKELLKGCTPVGTNAQGVPTCTFPAPSQWCAITIPTTLSSTYSAYGSTASSWWSRYRSEAVDFATYCPGRWYKAMNAMPGGGAWLNDTIAFAGCYEADHAVTATTTTTANLITPTPTAVSSSAAASSTSSSSATSTQLPNGKAAIITGLLLGILSNQICV
ncbi:hypothetical protein C2857_005986 [Epichloe festucae Fl1]|uniref:DUF7735 domain-containing protein n=1 Tax=Epichloe festucae (strain Fl1) TaxID=877507 RepID=A0A7S9KT60_EPIFF|nr:hypothetical protein C2857_005986 [Epichloe festucae Fl1]